MTPAARLEQPLVAEALNREVSDRNVLWCRQTAAAGPAAPIHAQTGSEGEVTPFTDERAAS